MHVDQTEHPSLQRRSTAVPPTSCFAVDLCQQMHKPAQSYQKRTICKHGISVDPGASVADLASAKELCIRVASKGARVRSCLLRTDNIDLNHLPSLMLPLPFPFTRGANPYTFRRRNLFSFASLPQVQSHRNVVRIALPAFYQFLYAIAGPASNIHGIILGPSVPCLRASHGVTTAHATAYCSESAGL